MNGGSWVAAASVSIALHLGALAAGLALLPHEREATLYIDFSALVPAPSEAESSPPLEDVRPIRAPALARAPATPRRPNGAPRSDPVPRERGAEPAPDQLRDHRARVAETETPRLIDDASLPLPPPPPAAPRVVASETVPRVEDVASRITRSDAAETILRVDPSNLAPPSDGRASTAAGGRDGALVPSVTSRKAAGTSDAASGAAGDGQRGPTGAGTASGDRQSSATVTPSSGQAGDADYGKYYGLLLRRIREALEYPSSARRRNVSGTVQLEIVVHPDGVIGEVTVIASSSHAVLDEAAVEAARSIRPLPFPAGLRPRTLRARLPVVFELR